MSSTHDPMETTPAHTSPPATDHNVNVDEPNNDDDASSDVSCGGNLRVRNFLFPSATTLLITNGTFRMTSRMPSKETLISRGGSPSAALSRRHPSPVYIFRGSVRLAFH